jgi:hypothetical protein
MQFVSSSTKGIFQRPLKSKLSATKRSNKKTLSKGQKKKKNENL